MPVYDFDTIVDRRDRGSFKWEKYRDRDIIPMWVADMDFRSPPPVIDALNQVTEHGVFGYVVPPVGAVDTIVGMLEREYRWTVEPHWIVWLPGLVPALNLACRAFCDPQQAVMITTPIYPPFLQAPPCSDRPLISVPLALDNDSWQFDFEAMAAALTSDTRLFMLCNPCNPVGRVFRQDELAALGQFCIEHDLIICSDEVHCQLLLDDVEHLPTATILPELAARTVTLLAPSKTYNLPGLCCACAIISDNKLRQRFKAQMRGIMPEMNSYGYAACQAAYTHGEQWRLELIDYLRGNRDLLESYVADQLPNIRMTHVEATYLAWLDVRDSGIENPMKFFEDAGVGLSDGREFGSEGFMRLNFGCPRATLTEGLDRMRAAL